MRKTCKFIPKFSSLQLLSSYVCPFLSLSLNFTPNLSFGLKLILVTPPPKVTVPHQAALLGWLPGNLYNLLGVEG